jgi:RimJ/RimL family protein N-acetyltransferase
MAEFRLETERLVLRSWREDDIDWFAKMCADERVMATLGPVMTIEQTAALIERISAIEAQNGYTAWVLETIGHGPIGWCGLIVGYEGLPIAGKTEVGWRIAFDHWGKGYAKEGAAASLTWGFEHQGLERIWAITSTQNPRSFGLMERLGMSRHYDLDFDHPKVADDSPLKPHVTYSIAREDWLTRR